MISIKSKWYNGDKECQKNPITFEALKLYKEKHNI